MDYPKSKIYQIFMDRVEFFIIKEQNKTWFKGILCSGSENYRLEIVGFVININLNLSNNYKFAVFKTLIGKSRKKKLNNKSNENKASNLIRSNEKSPRNLQRGFFLKNLGFRTSPRLF